MSTFKVLFYLKKNASKPNGKVPVMGRITVNGSIAQFSCKLDIAPSLWDLKATARRARASKHRRSTGPSTTSGFRSPGHYQRISDKDTYVSAIKIRDA